MKACKHPGICKLCGELKNLTREHVPPQKAFNDKPVMSYSFEEAIQVLAGADGRKPWDFSGLKGKQEQRGMYGWFLCDRCNNNTGSWYMSEYVDVTHVINDMINREKIEVNANCSFRLINCYPLRFFKAAMTMFCDINENCMGDDKLRQFLMEKEQCELDSAKKYELYMFLAPTYWKRLTPISAVGSIDGAHTLITEVINYPIGLLLYINRDPAIIPFGFEITNWSEYGYNDIANIDFTNVPYHEVVSMYPMDFRSREEFK